jgi:hypothetical protein
MAAAVLYRHCAETKSLNHLPSWLQTAQQAPDMDEHHHAICTRLPKREEPAAPSQLALQQSGQYGLISRLQAAPLVRGSKPGLGCTYRQIRRFAPPCASDAMI